MKKAIFLLLFTVFSSACYCQNLKINSESKIIIDSVLILENVNEENIYTGLKKWAASTFNNVKEVSVFDTPQEIQYRFVQNVSNGLTQIPIYTSLSIKIKPGKLKAEFSKMSWVDAGTTFESVLILKDGTLRDNKPSRNLIKSTEDNFKFYIEGIFKTVTAKPENW